MGWLLLVIAINILIATWNARMVGRVWDLAKGFEITVVLWSALVHSIIGYSSALVIGLGLGAYELNWLDEEFFVATVQLWYLGIIFPCIATGFIIWLHSVVETLRNPTLGNIAGSSWNTFAMYHNISGAFEDVPTAMEGVSKIFDNFKGGSSGGDDGGKGKVAIIIVIVSFIVGILLTAVVFTSGRRATWAELKKICEKERETESIHQRVRRHTY